MSLNGKFQCGGLSQGIRCEGYAGHSGEHTFIRTVYVDGERRAVGPVADYGNLHHRVRSEKDSSGADTMAMTHCGQRVYYTLAVGDWEDVGCPECHAQRTVPSGASA